MLFVNGIVESISLPCGRGPATDGGYECLMICRLSVFQVLVKNKDGKVVGTR